MKPEKVNINEADLDTLARLPGIGPTLAERIIEYRETAGPFHDTSELSEIYGISQAMVSDIVSLITVVEESEVEEGSAGEISEAEQVVPGQVEEEIRGESDSTAPGPRIGDESEGPMSDGSNLDELESEIHFLPDDELEEETAAEEDDSPVSEPGGEAVEGEDLDPPEADTEEPTFAPQARPTEAVVAGQETQFLQGRSGCSIQAAIAGALLGGLFGLLLTMFILYFLNGGMLQFAGSRTLRELEEESTANINEAKAEREALIEQMETLNGLVEDLNESVAAVATQQAELLDSISSTDEEVSDLESTVLGFDERISSVVEAAENFNTFLGGLQELVMEMAITAEPASSEAERATAPSTLEEHNPSVTETPASTPVPTEAASTRTPRPTGTPIGAQPASP